MSNQNTGNTEGSPESSQPSGNSSKLRSKSILNSQELQELQIAGVPISYDPIQGGWIPSNVQDDLIGFVESRIPVNQSIDKFSIQESITELNGLIPGMEESIHHLASSAKSQNLSSEEIQAQLNDIINTPLLSVARRIKVSLLDDFRAKMQWMFYQSLGEPFGKSGKSKTAEISFRAWNSEDLYSYFRFLNEPSMWEKIPDNFPTPFTKDTAKQYLDLAMLTNNHRVMAITQNNQPCGQIRILFDHNLTKENMFIKTNLFSGEISFWIAREFWGQGIMKQALKTFLIDLNKEQEIHYLYAWIRNDNIASQKAVLGAGFIKDDWVMQTKLAGEKNLSGYSRFLFYNINKP